MPSVALAIGGLMVFTAACSDAAGEPSVAGEPSGDTPSASTEWEPEYVDGVLQPLPDGFPEQPITIIVPDDPGTRDSIYARHWADAVNAASPVNVVVSDRPDFGSLWGTWSALEYMKADEGGQEGYLMVVAQIVGASQDTLSTEMSEELGLTLDDFNFVIGTEEVPFVLAQRKDPPWGSTDFDDMVEYVQANPGEVTYVCRGPGDGIDLTWKAYSEALGGLEFREVCGEDRQQMVSIVGAGDGDITFNTPNEVLVGVEAGRVDVIFVNGPEPVADDSPWAGVPNGATILGEDDPWRYPGGFAVAPEVPDLHRAWLFELFSGVMDAPELIEARSTVPGILLYDDPMDNEEARQAAEDNLEVIRPLLIDLDMCPGC